MKLHPAFYALPALAFALPLAAQVEEAPPPAAAAAQAAATSFPPLRPYSMGEEQEGSVLRELHEALEHYRRTGDARYATPQHRITPLHAAALRHELPLIKELIARGADPNARMQLMLWYRGDESANLHPADTPLTLALRCPRDASAACAQELAQTAILLHTLGADAGAAGYRDWGVLTCCLDGHESVQPAEAASYAPAPAWETLAGELLGMGAPAEGDDALGLIDRAWSRAFCQLMQDPQGDELRREHALLLLRRFAHYLEKPGHHRQETLLDMLFAFRPTLEQADALLRQEKEQGCKGLSGGCLHLRHIAQEQDEVDKEAARGVTKAEQLYQLASGLPDSLNFVIFYQPLPCLRFRAIAPTAEELNSPLAENRTALHMACACLAPDANSFFRPPAFDTDGAYTDLLDMMLTRGADACQRAGGSDHSCAADFIACNPAVQAELLRRGHKVLPPPHTFSRDTLTGLLSSVPAAAFSDEEARAARALLEELITRPQAFGLEQKRAQVLRAAGCALALLHRTAPEEAQRLICSQPFWRDPATWTQRFDEGGYADAAAMLRHARKLTLPPAWVAETALFAASIIPEDAAAEAGAGPIWRWPQMKARDLLALLIRDHSPEADAVLEELCSERTPMLLRGAAWETRLLRDDLPTLRHHELEHWLRQECGLEVKDIPAELKDALCADRAAHSTSPVFSTLICPDTLETTAEEAVAGLRAIGAPKAAAFYARHLAELEKKDAEAEATGTDELDELEFADDDDIPETPEQRRERLEAHFELECAYARHIWQHREHFYALREESKRQQQNQQQD